MTGITMKKFMMIFLFVLCFFIYSSTVMVKADAEEERTVYLSATEYDYPPFSVTDGGKADGFSVDLLKAVAEEMGITVTFKIDQWTTLKEELKTGELDILPLVGYTEERDEVYDFTVPYIVMRGNIFVRVGDDSIQSQDDLVGKEILVLNGDNSQEWAWSIGLDEELTATTTYLEAFELLASGKYDAILAQGLVGEKLISDHEFSDIEAVYNYANDGMTRQKLNLEGYEQKFCFAVVEGDAELLSMLNEGLLIVSQNGSYDELYQKWFPFLIAEEQINPWDVAKIVIYVLIPVFAILVGVFYVTTKRTIRNKTEQIEKNNNRNEIIVEAFQKDFKTNNERFEYVLKEILMLSESQSGFMFSVDRKGKIVIKTCCSIIKKDKCDHSKMILLIKENELINKTLTQLDRIIENEYTKSDYKTELVICGNKVEKLLSVSIQSINKKYVIIMVNKKNNYSKDNANQASILLTGLWTMLERAEQVDKIEFMSFHDSLTGLYNRRFFEEELRRVDNPRNFPISIIMGDVNGLKLVNDAFGHSAGDKLLKSIGNIISKNIRANDTAARWGGDEFAIILPNTSSKQAENLIERINKETKDVNFDFGSLSISFGTESKKVITDVLRNVFIKAEEAMYQNKLNVIESVRGETIKTIMNTLFEKSSEIKSHSERVSSIAVSIAQKAGLSKTKINDVKTIGMIHDIGKIIIDSSILDKPSKLDSHERSIIEQHPVSGSKMLTSTHEYTRLASGVLHHHEKIDGTGYPNGLVGDEIPLESRIIAVADAFDAMTAQRPYRLKPLSIEEAVLELQKHSGTQFDSTFVDIFVNQVLGENNI